MAHSQFSHKHSCLQAGSIFKLPAAAEIVCGLTARLPVFHKHSVLQAGSISKVPAAADIVCGLSACLLYIHFRLLEHRPNINAMSLGFHAPLALCLVTVYACRRGSRSSVSNLHEAGGLLTSMGRAGHGPPRFYRVPM